ncbi:hypothetical protein FNV43_RR07766 [Rhamnella rubrinervis]|uniref:Ubiquitin-like domain-containing protein n=1 Tax=Rhamnella rubrinervis TaxID=2594499 RepID=A0A8K0MNB0_9ROSA|nr:hypothetical protein FNV43_RR07766 [Rhamnella rubrinervis]
MIGKVITSTKTALSIRLASNGELMLNNDLSLSDANIVDGTHLVVVIQIHVEWYGKVVSQYDISVETTIMELKKKIEKDHAIGMAAEMQELHFNGKSLDEDQLKLEDYNVPSHGATIIVFTKFQLSVRKDGVSHPFAVHNGMTVGDLEKIVAQHFGKITTQIVLDLEGEILLDDVVLSAVKFEGSELSVSFAKW